MHGSAASDAHVVVGCINIAALAAAGLLGLRRALWEDLCGCLDACRVHPCITGYTGSSTGVDAALHVQWREVVDVDDHTACCCCAADDP